MRSTCIAALAIVALSLTAAKVSGEEGGNGATLASVAGGGGDTRTPIQHLIVVIGENHSFDNVFATYVPPDPTQTVWNLLSEGIIDRAGLPGARFAKARQQQATDTTLYRSAPRRTGAFLYLPQPNTGLNGYPTSLCVFSIVLEIAGRNPAHLLWCSDIGLPPAAQALLAKGGTGQGFYVPPYLYPVPDCRYPANLPNGPYWEVGASLVHDCPIPVIAPTRFYDNVGDPVHRFFAMRQQSDCRTAAMSAANPSGCLHDLYAWVATSVGWQLTENGEPPIDDEGTFQGGVAMGFYNMAGGDYRYFESLAQRYAINDNYHQFIMGGTGPNSQSILTADEYYYTDSDGNPAAPPADLIENPNPQPGSDNFYTHAGLGTDDLGNTSTGGLVDCSDETQPGVAAIRQYLRTLPYRPFNGGNCMPGRYYQVDNEYPSYDHLGNPNRKGNEFPAGPAFAIGPQTIPTIGDALSAKGLSWKYYSEGFEKAERPPLANQMYCVICNAFQYSRSTMTSPLKNNLVDLPTFFMDVRKETLPAVSFIKPDVLVDSHPGTSTPPLFEAFAERIIGAVQQNKSIWKNSAILLTFDESGGYYDSGYIQAIDFFGDGPRTVMIAVSPFAKIGYVDHTYSDHASIAKFIEYNWKLQPLSARSRDNLPNPKASPAAPYIPTNPPAIGDLTGMFDFPQ